MTSQNPTRGNYKKRPPYNLDLCTAWSVITAKKYLKPWHQNFDDLVQQGLVKSFQAYDSWDETKGSSFDTYSCRYISGGIRNYVKKERNNYELPCDLQGIENDYTKWSFMMNFAEEDHCEKDLIFNEQMKRVEKFKKMLQKGVKSSILLYFTSENSKNRPRRINPKKYLPVLEGKLRGERIVDIAKSMKMSKSSVDFIEKQMFKIMREYIFQDDLTKKKIAV